MAKGSEWRCAALSSSIAAVDDVVDKNSDIRTSEARSGFDSRDVVSIIFHLFLIFISRSHSPKRLNVISWSFSADKICFVL